MVGLQWSELQTEARFRALVIRVGVLTAWFTFAGSFFITSISAVWITCCIKNSFYIMWITSYILHVYYYHYYLYVKILYLSTRHPSHLRWCLLEGRGDEWAVAYVERGMTRHKSSKSWAWCAGKLLRWTLLQGTVSMSDDVVFSPRRKGVTSNTVTSMYKESWFKQYKYNNV